jgi:hypothetical protein
MPVRPQAEGLDQLPSLFFWRTIPVPTFPEKINPTSITEIITKPLAFSKRDLGMPLVLGSRAVSSTWLAARRKRSG